MTMIVAMIEHTPIWVFPLILLVLLMAGRNLRHRNASVRTLFILPVVLLFLSLGNVLGAKLPAATAFPLWFAAVAVGAAIGWAIARPPIRVDRHAGRMELAGSSLPLIVCIGIVALRYYFGYLFGRYPELQGDPTYAIELIVGGALLSGFMLGRYGKLGWSYVKATRVYPALGAEPSL